MQFPATAAGYAALAAFIITFGPVTRIGVEGTVSYGAGLSRQLRRSGFEVVEVIRPNRQVRRLHGKSDPIDAYAAARTALAEASHPIPPKTADGPVEAIRFLTVARRSAIKARTVAQVQIKTLLVTAPEPLRQRYRDVSNKALVTGLARVRPNTDPLTGPITAALRSLARRHEQLTVEIDQLDIALEDLVKQTAPALHATKASAPSPPHNC